MLLPAGHRHALGLPLLSLIWYMAPPALLSHTTRPPSLLLDEPAVLPSTPRPSSLSTRLPYHPYSTQVRAAAGRGTRRGQWSPRRVGRRDAVRGVCVALALRGHGMACAAWHHRAHATYAVPTPRTPYTPMPTLCPRHAHTVPHALHTPCPRRAPCDAPCDAAQVRMAAQRTGWAASMASR